MVIGKVIQFRRSLKHYQPRHFILNVNVDSKEKAAKFVGKEVVWKSESGKLIKGKISAAHGNKGMVRAIFERGLPGQALNTDIEIK